MTDSLSFAEARALVLDCQGLARGRTFGSGSAGVKKAIEHLGYVQIDTLSVIARAIFTPCGIA
ncbi:MAG: hypothetical protein P8R01_00060 [Gammaproteobacteria bacterium]|nr:hypothetical protein [Gammaproteobacteria bacterium]